MDGLTGSLAYPEVSEGAVVQRQLCHTTPVPVGQSLRSAVAAPQCVLLCQQTLQLRRCAACDQSPYQGEDVVVEVCLNGVKEEG